MERVQIYECVSELKQPGNSHQGDAATAPYVLKHVVMIGPSIRDSDSSIL